VNTVTPTNGEILQLLLRRRIFRYVLLSIFGLLALSLGIHGLRLKNAARAPIISMPVVSSDYPGGPRIMAVVDSIITANRPSIMDSLPQGQIWRYQVTSTLFPETRLRSDQLILLLRCVQCGPPVVRVLKYAVGTPAVNPILLSDERMFWNQFWRSYPKIVPHVIDSGMMNEVEMTENSRRPGVGPITNY
jgi:hypothetical protein